MHLIVGLGNPGPTYASTRHNVGFMFIDWLKSKNFPNLSYQKKFKSEFFRGKLLGVECVFLKPQTYMNCSGQSVQEALAFFKLDISQVIVISDDLDQALFAVKARAGGGHGGHNGLRDIMEKTGEENFHRIKIGIGKPLHKTHTSDWVLAPFSQEERDSLERESFEESMKRISNILKQSYKS